MEQAPLQYADYIEQMGERSMGSLDREVASVELRGLCECPAEVGISAPSVDEPSSAALATAGHMDTERLTSPVGLQERLRRPSSTSRRAQIPAADFDIRGGGFQTPPRAIPMPQYHIY